VSNLIPEFWIYAEHYFLDGILFGFGIGVAATLIAVMVTTGGEDE
jgi:hypothetical protein